MDLVSTLTALPSFDLPLSDDNIIAACEADLLRVSEAGASAGGQDRTRAARCGGVFIFLCDLKLPSVLQVQEVLRVPLAWPVLLQQVCAVLGACALDAQAGRGARVGAAHEHAGQQ